MRPLAILGGTPAFAQNLAFARPASPPLERVVRRLAPSYDRGILTNGPLVRELEDAAAIRLGVDHVVAVSSCTSGLMLAVRALAPDGPVLLPSFTFSASAHAVAWNGLGCRFAECDPATFQLDVADARTRAQGIGAVMATHLFGAPSPVEDVCALAAEAGVPVLFDAAHGFGSRHLDRAIGSFGDAEVFSLSPTKPLVAGEGGLVATNRDDVATGIRLGRDYGNPGDYDTRFVGLNARMSELHAAVALESLADLDENLAARRSLAARYASQLAELGGVQLQVVAEGDVSTWKDLTISIDPIVFGVTRDVVVTALRAEGVDTRNYFSPPVHRQQSHAGANPARLPVTEQVAARVVSLPLYRQLSLEDVDRVVSVLGEIRAGAASLAQFAPVIDLTTADADAQRAQSDKARA